MMWQAWTSSITKYYFSVVWLVNEVQPGPSTINWGSFALAIMQYSTHGGIGTALAAESYVWPGSCRRGTSF